MWGFLLFLLFLAFREHRARHVEVWREPVPAYPWFGTGEKATKEGLPAPVTAMHRRRSSRRKDSMRRPAVAVAAGLNEKDKGNAKEKRRSAFWVWVEKPRGQPKAKTREKETRRDTTAPTPTAPRRVVRDTVINITRPTVPRASTTPARVSTQPPPRTTSRTLTQPQLLPRTQLAPRAPALARTKKLPKIQTQLKATKR